MGLLDGQVALISGIGPGMGRVFASPLARAVTGQWLDVNCGTFFQ